MRDLPVVLVLEDSSRFLSLVIDVLRIVSASVDTLLLYGQHSRARSRAAILNTFDIAAQRSSTSTSMRVVHAVI